MFYRMRLLVHPQLDDIWQPALSFFRKNLFNRTCGIWRYIPDIWCSQDDLDLLVFTLESNNRPKILWLWTLARTVLFIVIAFCLCWCDKTKNGSCYINF